MNTAEGQLKSLKQSIAKIEKHITQAKTALKKREDGVKDLKALMQKSKGIAKKELQKSVKKEESKITDLKAHIKEGS